MDTSWFYANGHTLHTVFAIYIISAQMLANVTSFIWSSTLLKKKYGYFNWIYAVEMPHVVLIFYSKKLKNQMGIF